MKKIFVLVFLLAGGLIELWYGIQTGSGSPPPTATFIVKFCERVQPRRSPMMDLHRSPIPERVSTSLHQVLKSVRRTFDPNLTSW